MNVNLGSMHFVDLLIFSILDVLPRNPVGIPGWVPKEPRQNRKVAQNGDSFLLMKIILLF